MSRWAGTFKQVSVKRKIDKILLRSLSWRKKETNVISCKQSSLLLTLIKIEALLAKNIPNVWEFSPKKIGK